MSDTLKIEVDCVRGRSISNSDNFRFFKMNQLLQFGKIYYKLEEAMGQMEVQKKGSNYGSLRIRVRYRWTTRFFHSKHRPYYQGSGTSSANSQKKVLIWSMKQFYENILVKWYIMITFSDYKWQLRFILGYRSCNGRWLPGNRRKIRKTHQSFWNISKKRSRLSYIWTVGYECNHET